MPATINGSPTHVLIVHAVVVLLPLSILASLVLVAIPRSRRSFGLASVLIAFVGCAAVPLAFLTGRALRSRVAPSPLISRHVSLAHQLLPAAAIFGLLLAAFVVVDVLRRSTTGELNGVEQALLTGLPFARGLARRHRLVALHRLTAALLVVAAALTLVTVIRVGDSGAKAAWHGRLHSAGARR